MKTKNTLKRLVRLQGAEVSDTMGIRKLLNITKGKGKHRRATYWKSYQQTGYSNNNMQDNFKELKATQAYV